MKHRTNFDVMAAIWRAFRRPRPALDADTARRIRKARATGTFVVKTCIGPVTKAADGTIGVVLSTSAEDRDGDVIDPSGWDLDAYRKNPIVMFAHDYTKPAVGRALGIAVLGDSLRARVKFAPTERGRELETLYSQGFMRAWSVGFDVKESQPRGKGKGRRYVRQELLEVSAVPVPSNAAALTEEN